MCGVCFLQSAVTCLHTNAKLLVFVAAYLFFGVLNNVGATLMGDVMPVYPAFLLYGTTIMYTILFLCIALWQGESPFGYGCTRQRMGQYGWLALWTALNGLFFQFSDPWVDGDLQQVLTNMQIPITFLFARWLLEDKYTKRELLGTGIVVVAVLVGMVPVFTSLSGHASSSQESTDAWYWVAMFLISVCFQSVESVYQERAFLAPNKCRPATCLFWYNLMSLLPYTVTIFMEAVPYLNGTTQGTSLSAAFDNQAHAFACYFNDPYPSDTVGPAPNCHSLSWLWPTVFVFGYGGMFFLQAVLIDRFNVVFAVVVSSLLQPLSALVFLSPAIVGAGNTHSMSPWVVVSFCIAFLGLLIKSKPAGKGMEEGSLNADAFAAGQLEAGFIRLEEGL